MVTSFLAVMGFSVFVRIPNTLANLLPTAHSQTCTVIDIQGSYPWSLVPMQAVILYIVIVLLEVMFQICSFEILHPHAEPTVYWSVANICTARMLWHQTWLWKKWNEACHQFMGTRMYPDYILEFCYIVSNDEAMSVEVDIVTVDRLAL